MIDLPDVNVLVALVLPQHMQHDRAVSWWSTMQHCATTPVTEMGLVRLLLQPAVVGAMVTFEAAMTILRSIKDDGRVAFIPDDVSVSALANLAIIGAKQVTDMHLLTLAQHHAARLVTFDSRLASGPKGADATFVALL